ncbi:MAG: SDR family oxidoreductase [Candidatus Sumerlaeia bacterium]|nr:SDR family oxidoreductase [Candidatus Sumerlaeia bacterium]
MVHLLATHPLAQHLRRMIPPGTRFLVTGGAGFIGSHLAAELVALGMRVRVLDNFATGRRQNLAAVADRIELLEGSVADPEACRAACAGVAFVLHHAAVPSVARSVADPRECHEANVAGTLNMLEAARAAGVRRLVYAASSSAYGDLPVEWKREDLRPAPQSPYAAAKLAAEHYCAAWTRVYGLDTVSLRYFNVFGPRQDPASDYAAVIPRFAARMLRGERPVIYGDGGQTRDFTYIANNVRAVLLACVAEDVAGRVFNIACGRAHSLLELVAALNAVLGTAIEPEFSPPAPGDVRHSKADISAARAALGYEPEVEFEEGLRRTVDWLRAETSRAGSS